MTEKVYILSKRDDAELEKLIYDMDEYHLRLFLYGIARGWEFDECCFIAEQAFLSKIETLTHN